MFKRLLSPLLVALVVAGLLTAGRSTTLPSIRPAAVFVPRLAPLGVTAQPTTWEALAPAPTQLNTAVSRDGGGAVRLPSDGNLLWLHSDTGGLTVPGGAPYLKNNTVAISSPADPLAVREPLNPQGVPYQLVLPGPGFTCPSDGVEIVWISGAIVLPQPGWDRVLIYTPTFCLDPADQSLTPRSIGLAQFDYSPAVGADLSRPWSDHVTILSEDLGLPNGMAQPMLGADGMIYVYDCPVATVGTITAPVGCRAGRVAPDDAADRTRYRFWNGTGWNATTVAAATYLDLADNVSPPRYPAGMFKVSWVPAMGLYVWAGQAWPGYQGTSIIRVAQAPQGPWSLPVSANYIGCTGLDGHICYGSEIIPDLSDATHLGLVYFDRNGQDPNSTTAGAVVSNVPHDPATSGQTHFIRLGVAPPTSRSPELAIADVTTPEAQGGTHAATATITLSPPSIQTVTAAWSTSNGTATAPSDYTPSSGTVTFVPGQTTATITVPVKGDSLSEIDETVVVTLTSPTNAVLADDRGLVTIADDDEAAAVTIADASVTQLAGDPASTTLDVSLSFASGQTVTVPYRTVDGTATAPADYVAATGTVTFLPGETAKTVAVTVQPDRFAQPARTFGVELGAVAGASVADGTGAVTIVNANPTKPTIAISDVTVDEGAGAASFPVTRAGVTTYAATAAWSTTDGTATAGQDYVASSGTVAFAPGQTAATVTVPIVQGSTNDPDETFAVTLADPDAATLATSTATATIVSNVALPVVSISGGGSLTQGSNTFFSAKYATVTVSLDAPSGRTVTVGLHTTPGTADASDFVPTDTTVTFAPGQTTKTITIGITQDTTAEFVEQFTVDLANPAFATLGTASVPVTIINSVPDPKISIAGKSVNEGAGTVSLNVTLSAPSAKPITVGWSTKNFTAVAPTNYLAAAGTVTFAPGQTLATVTVGLVNDSTRQFTRTFNVNLATPVNASIWAGSATVTILDNDLPPTVSIADQTVTEGNGGFFPTKAVSLSVTLSAPTDYTVTVPWSTADGSARAPGDYVAASGTITVPKGVTAAKITVLVVGNTRFEANKTATVNLGPAVNATTGRATATLTIVNDDGPPTVAITGKTVAESSGTVALTVALNAPSSDPVTVAWTTADFTAVAGRNYQAASGTVTIPAGQATTTIPITLIDDARRSATKVFYVQLSAPVGAALANAKATVTVTDNDPPPTVSINDLSLNETNGGFYANTSGLFTVTLSAPTDYTVTVAWSTANGSAVAPSDFAAASGTLTFFPGQTSATIRAVVVGDRTVEADETATVTLSAPVNATLGRAGGILTIRNDDV